MNERVPERPSAIEVAASCKTYEEGRIRRSTGWTCTSTPAEYVALVGPSAAASRPCCT